MHVWLLVRLLLFPHIGLPIAQEDLNLDKIAQKAMDRPKMLPMAFFISGHGDSSITMAFLFGGEKWLS